MYLFMGCVLFVSTYFRSLDFNVASKNERNPHFRFSIVFNVVYTMAKVLSVAFGAAFILPPWQAASWPKARECTATLEKRQ